MLNSALLKCLLIALLIACVHSNPSRKLVSICLNDFGSLCLYELFIELQFILFSQLELRKKQFHKTKCIGNPVACYGKRSYADWDSKSQFVDQDKEVFERKISSEYLQKLSKLCLIGQSRQGCYFLYLILLSQDNLFIQSILLDYKSNI